MHHITRFSNRAVIVRENVAEHSWDVAFIAMILALDLEPRVPAPGLTGAVLKRAVLHDISECQSGDVVRPYKYASQAMRNATQEADRVLTDQLVTGEVGGATGMAMIYLWEHAKDDGLAGEIVAFADMATVLAYCQEERKMGNRHLDGARTYCADLLLQKFGDHQWLGDHAVRVAYPTWEPREELT
jgi:5'-deoxynucleotidase